MGIIKLMNEDLYNKINAGEVVESYYSVVKELVENSIDAKSKHITIELVNSGITSIKIIDDGLGMDKEDAINCFLRHASSKLYKFEDLYRITSLGFRGEALASIASVSDVYLETSNGVETTFIHIKGGTIVDTKSTSRSRGTTIEVKNLFYNTPARLKHLKKTTTESYKIINSIQRIALSNPSISFKIINDDKVIFLTSGDDNVLKVINNVYGLEITKSMKKFSCSNYDYSVNGFYTLPHVSKSNSKYITIIVNGRIVNSLNIVRSIKEAYHTYLMDNRYPVVVLNIECDPSLIDVNIHPNKKEIKFSFEEELCNLIKDSIRKSLETQFVIKPAICPKKETTYDNLKLELSYINEENTQYNVPINKIEEVQDEQVEQQKTTFPYMEVVGVVFGTYLVCQNEEGMYLLDIHASKERINYENILDNMYLEDVMYINLLLPLKLELTSSEFNIIKENIDYLNTLGFNISEFGHNTIVVKSHPTWIKDNIDARIKYFIETFISKGTSFSKEKFNETIAINMACKMSIKANTSISNEEAVNLLKDLSTCNNPYNCPHGRPTIINYSKYELEKLFKRMI